MIYWSVAGLHYRVAEAISCDSSVSSDLVVEFLPSDNTGTCLDPVVLDRED